MLPCASHADVGRAREQVALGRRRIALRRLDRAFDRLGTAAQHHHDPPFGVELDDHVRPLVHDPDVVVLVDAHLVRELEAVDALAPFLDEGAVRVELEQARVVAAGVDEDVPLRIGRDAHALAEIHVGRHLQEVRDRLKRDLRDVLRLRSASAPGHGRSGPPPPGRRRRSSNVSYAAPSPSYPATEPPGYRVLVTVAGTLSLIHSTTNSMMSSLFFSSIIMWLLPLMPTSSRRTKSVFTPA